MRERLLDLLPSALSGDPREQVLYVLALGLLLLGTVLCLVALRVTVLDVLAVAFASSGAAAWLLSNGPAEGGVLLEVLPGNGLTWADLAALPAAGLVAALAWRRVRSR